MRYLLLLVVLQLLFLSCGPAWAIDRELPVLDKLVKMAGGGQAFADTGGGGQDDSRGLVLIFLLIVGAGVLSWVLIFAQSGQYGKALLLISVLSFVLCFFVSIIPIFLLVPLFAFGGYRLIRRPRYTRQPDVQVDHVTVYREVQVQPQVMRVVIPHVVTVNRFGSPASETPAPPAEGHLYHPGLDASPSRQDYGPYPDYVLPTQPEYPDDGRDFPGPYAD